VALRRDHEALAARHRALEAGASGTLEAARAQAAAEAEELRGRLRAAAPAAARIAALEAEVAARDASAAGTAAVLDRLRAEADELRCAAFAASHLGRWRRTGRHACERPQTCTTPDLPLPPDPSPQARA